MPSRSALLAPVSGDQLFPVSTSSHHRWWPDRGRREINILEGHSVAVGVGTGRRGRAVADPVGVGDLLPAVGVRCGPPPGSAGAWIGGVDVQRNRGPGRRTAVPAAQASCVRRQGFVCLGPAAVHADDGELPGLRKISAALGPGDVVSQRRGIRRRSPGASSAARPAGLPPEQKASNDEEFCGFHERPPPPNEQQRAGNGPLRILGVPPMTVTGGRYWT